MSVILEWLGHCAFRLSANGGPRILIDPYDDSIGYKMPDYGCDILLISHSHYDTSGVQHVPGKYSLIDSRGTTQVGDYTFKSYHGWHDKNNGRDFGECLIFSFHLDGLHWVYFSHIGDVPRDWILEELRPIDVAFIPVGGVFAMGPLEAKFLVDRISPRLVVPMHFDTKSLNFTLLPLVEFRKTMGEVWEVDDWKVSIDGAQIGSGPILLQMKYWMG